MTENKNPNKHKNHDLDAALDGIPFAARLHKHTPTLSFLSPPGGQSPDPDALLTGRRLELATENPDPADRRATELLLASFQRPDGWHCPRCEEVFTDPTIFAEHLVDEFNRGMAAYASAITGKQPPDTKPPPK